MASSRYSARVPASAPAACRAGGRAALAPLFIDEIYATLAALNRAGIALLIVEQNVRRILDAAHRVVVLDMGRNAFAGASAELRQSDRIRRLYLGEDAG